MQSLKDPKNMLGILVVEDDRPTRDILGLVIARKFPDAVIHMAENGKEGVEAFREHKPEVVVTDIKMPVMDGIEMAAEIKAVKPDTQFIVVTAFNTKYHLERFSEIGFCAYLTKPIEFVRLFEAIEKCAAEVSTVRNRQRVTPRMPRASG